MWQVTYLFLFRALTDLVERVTGTTPSGVLNTAWMGLYLRTTAAIGPNSTMAQIVEASYNGYARQLVTWFPVITSSGGAEAVYGPTLFFGPTDALNPQQITGVFLADAVYAGALLMAAALPSPGVTLAGPSNGIVVKPAFQLTTSQVYGGPEVES